MIFLHQEVLPISPVLSNHPCPQAILHSVYSFSIRLSPSPTLVPPTRRDHEIEYSDFSVIYDPQHSSLHNIHSTQEIYWTNIPITLKRDICQDSKIKLFSLPKTSSVLFRMWLNSLIHFNCLRSNCKLTQSRSCAHSDDYKSWEMAKRIWCTLAVLNLAWFCIPLLPFSP